MRQSPTLAEWWVRIESVPILPFVEALGVTRNPIRRLLCLRRGSPHLALLALWVGLAAGCGDDAQVPRTTGRPGDATAETAVPARDSGGDVRPEVAPADIAPGDGSTDGGAGTGLDGAAGDSAIGAGGAGGAGGGGGTAGAGGNGGTGGSQPIDAPIVIETAPEVPSACTSTCRADEVGSHCRDNKTVATCTASGACFVSSGGTSCTGVKVCGGTPGAAACVCPTAAATPAAGEGCPSMGAKACGGTAILTCSVDLSGSGCLVWTKSQECADMGLACAEVGGAQICRCPAASATELSVDPVAGVDSGPLTPTGAAMPAGCRFKTIARALTEAGSRSLRIVARSATRPATFDAEAFPLRIPAGVTLSTEDANLDPASFRLVYRSPTGPAEAMVVLGAGAGLEGFTLDNPLAPVPAAVLATAGQVTVRGVKTNVAGAGRFVRAISIGSDALPNVSALVEKVTIAKADIGLFVGSVAAAATTARTLAVEDANIGIEIAAGIVAVETASLTKSASGLLGQGMKLRGGATPVRLTGSGLVIRNPTRLGVELVGPAGAMAPQLTLTGGEISGAGENGLTIDNAVASLTGTNVRGNTGWGIEASGAATDVTLGVGTKVDANRYGGIYASTGAKVTGTGISASSNVVGDGRLTDGVRVAGGTVVLHDSTLDDNEGRAIAINGGSAVIDQGSRMRGNGRNGGSSSIRHQAGNLTIGGTEGGIVELSGSGRHGIYVWTDEGVGAGQVNVIRTKISGHAANGILVDVVEAGAYATVSITDSEISGNDSNGLRIDRARADGSSMGVKLLRTTVSGNGIAGNDGRGIWVQGLGNVELAVEASTIRNNRGPGVYLEQGTGAVVASSFSGNEVSGNNTGREGSVAGVHFVTASTLRSFRGNRVFANLGHQVGFSARPNGGASWTLGGAACDASANRIHCYAGTSGVYLSGSAAIQVDARSTSWQNASPSEGTDWARSGASAGTVMTSSACGAAGVACP